MLQRNVLCTVLQADANIDANFRMEQGKGLVDPRRLINGSLGEVQEQANIQKHESGVFAVSMSILMCLAPARVGQYVSANLNQYGQR